MNRKLHIKIFICLILILIFFNSSCFASFDFEYNDKSYSYKDLPDTCTDNNYILFYDTSYSDFRLYVSFADNSFYTNGTYLKTKVDATVYRYYYGSWVKDMTLRAGENYGYLLSILKPVIITFNVYDTDGNIVFAKPQTYTLMPIVEQIENKENLVQQSFKEILAIIPVALTVFVFLIGIRKAISFIKTELKHS